MGGLWGFGVWGLRRWHFVVGMGGSGWRRYDAEGRGEREEGRFCGGGTLFSRPRSLISLHGFWKWGRGGGWDGDEDGKGV